MPKNEAPFTWRELAAAMALFALVAGLLWTTFVLWGVQ
jgi:hypothetical protein